MLSRSCRGLSLRPVAKGPRNVSVNRLRLYSTTNLADQYHSKVSVLPFTNDVLSIQQKLDLLVPPMFGLGAAIKGYAQMIFGPDAVNSGIKRTNFKPVYIPTWTVDCVSTFTSILDDSEHSTTMQLRDVIVPGVNHHPLARWVKHFPEDIENAKPFSKDHLEPIDNKHDILALPFTTSPLAIPEAFNAAPYGDIVIEEGRDWAVDPHSVKFQMLAAYPLLHPVFLAEYTLEEKHITVLAHGYHDYFSVWGHTSHPDEWVNSEQGATVAYLAVTKPIIGGPLAMPDALTRANTEDNLDLIAKQADMNDLRVQPLSSARPTRSWMALAGKVSQLKFLVESIPADAHIIKIGMTSDREDNSSDVARAPLKKQLKALEAEAEAAKPEWLKRWETESSKQ